MIKNQTIKNDKGGNFIETVNFNSFHTKVKGKLNKCQVLICQLSSLLSLLMIYPNQGAGLHFNSSSLFISQSILHDAYLAHPCLLVKPAPHQKIFLVQLSAKLAPRPPFCQNLLIHFIFCNPRQPLIRTWNKSSRKICFQKTFCWPWDFKSTFPENALIYHMVYCWKSKCAKAKLVGWVKFYMYLNLLQIFWHKPDKFQQQLVVRLSVQFCTPTICDANDKCKSIDGFSLGIRYKVIIRIIIRIFFPSWKLIDSQLFWNINQSTVIGSFGGGSNQLASLVWVQHSILSK